MLGMGKCRWKQKEYIRDRDIDALNHVLSTETEDFFL